MMLMADREEINPVKDYRQYFTPGELARFMVHLIPGDAIHFVVDLTMGECRLLDEAKKRWNEAKLYGADIDEGLIRKMNIESPYIHTFQCDSLSEKIEEWTEYREIVEAGGFDLAIANPPFNFLDQALICLNGGERLALPIEIRFLIRYIDIVKESGYICIILPYGFLSLDLYRELRRNLLMQVTILKIIKIYDGCFQKTDADTCVVFMQKRKREEKNIQKEISIEYLDGAYRLTDRFMVVTDTADRWDLEYQCLQKETREILEETGFQTDVLGNYVAECRRGKSVTKNKQLLSERGVRFIHTTDVKALYLSNEARRYVLDDNGFFRNAVLHEEEILVGRVGQGCIGKIAIVCRRYPKMFFSDCLYAVKATEINPYYLTLFLASSMGKMQMRGRAKGSCSKYITRDDLFQIRILVPDKKVQDYFGSRYREILSRPGRGSRAVPLGELLLEMERAMKIKE